MTDLERFIDTYKQFGIDVKVIDSDKGSWVYLNGAGSSGIEATYSDRFGGYEGFYSYLEFDKNGKFVWQGFYE